MNYQNTNINPELTLLEALKKMDITNRKLLIVEKNDLFIGLLSIGDIQRAIIKNISLDTKIFNILRKDFKIASTEDTLDEIKKMMFEDRIELCPVVNKKSKIINIHYWEDLFKNKKNEYNKKINLPVVIMAGGLGERLKPLTNVIPKPLLPINDNTIIEEIFSRFSKYDCNNFFLSINYKSELIKFYIENQKLSYNINFFKENKPLGTAGSLSLLKNKINETFFITNCDCLIDQDYFELLKYHQDNKNEMTIVSSLKNLQIPYGTITTKDNGMLDTLDEKPNLTLQVNSGMYILEPHLINEIPKDTFFHMTDLVSTIINRKGRIGVFPVSDQSWVDIGTWNQYLNVIDK